MTNRKAAMLGITIAWTTCITLPMSLAMTWGILKASNPPDWVWLIFWLQIPVGIVTAIIQGFLKQAFEDKE